MTLEELISGIFGGQGNTQLAPAPSGQTPNDLIMTALGAPSAAQPPAPAFGMRRPDSERVTQGGLQSVGRPQPSPANAAPAPSAAFPEGRAENSGLSFVRSPQKESPIAPPSSRLDAMMPQSVPEPSFGDRAAAYVDGAGKHGLLGGIVDAFTAPDAAAKAKREQIRNGNLTYKAMIGRGIDPDSAQAIVLNPELQKAVLPKIFTPKEPGKPTGLMQNFEYAKQSGFGGSFMDFMKAGQVGAQATSTPEARRASAAQFGLKEDDPRFQSYVLTGKFPREDAQSLTAVDKKAILEADELVAANESGISMLDKALEVSPKAYDGMGASGRAWAANNLVPWNTPEAAATADLDNIITGQALASLKATFGAAPTEGERKILVELSGSSNQPADVRKGIFERAKGLAEKRLAFNKQRAAELRGGTFYKPQGGEKPDAPRQISSDEEYTALPAGTTYIDPKGNQRTKQ